MSPNDGNENSGLIGNGYTTTILPLAFMQDLQAPNYIHGSFLLTMCEIRTNLLLWDNEGLLVSEREKLNGPLNITVHLRNRKTTQDNKQIA